jgi:hypothetical protein
MLYMHTVSKMIVSLLELYEDGGRPKAAWRLGLMRTGQQTHGPVEGEFRLVTEYVAALKDHMKVATFTAGNVVLKLYRADTLLINGLIFRITGSEHEEFKNTYTSQTWELEVLRLE